MSGFGPDNIRCRLSIPVKVVLTTGIAYVLVWGAELALAASGRVDLSGKLLGIDVRILITAMQVLVAACAATAAIHIFLDRPLTHLMKAMRRAEEGDFLIRAPVLADDELGLITHAFNRLVSKVTDLSASNIQADQDVVLMQEQSQLRHRLEEKNSIIERTNKTLEYLVRDLSLIYEIGQEVNSIIDLERLYSTITVTLQKYLRINEFALLVYDDKGEALQVLAAYGFEDEDEILRTSFRAGEGITGLVAETGRKIYIKDTSRETRFLHYKRERPAQTSSFLSIPLVFKDEVLGVINFSRHGKSSFSYQDVKMLSLVAGQVALAIANARLYTRTRELSVRDELTGINNRRHFQQMLQMEWKRAVRFRRMLSLVMIDVDHFKAYNDTFGHLQGDVVLRQIGALLKRNLREVDTVARFGGEEFVLLLPDTDKHGATAVAEKVRLLVDEHHFLTEKHRQTRRITISSGVATFPDDVSEMDDLIDHADIALYRAKELGRNRVEVFASPESPAEEEVTGEISTAETIDRRRPEKDPDIIH